MVHGPWSIASVTTDHRRDHRTYPPPPYWPPHTIPPSCRRPPSLPIGYYGHALSKINRQDSERDSPRSQSEIRIQVQENTHKFTLHSSSSHASMVEWSWQVGATLESKMKQCPLSSLATRRSRADYFVFLIAKRHWKMDKHTQ